ADIYALGKIIYEAIVGKMGPDTIPFKSARLPEADSPFFRELDLILQQATAEEKTERFSSIEEFREAMAAALVRSRQKPSIARQTFEGKKLRWKATTIIAVLLVLIGLVALYLHERPHIDSPQKTSAPGSVQKLENGQEPGEPPPLQSTGPPPARLQGKDYDIMRLVPGGEITLPQDFGPDGGNSVKVKSFYMNETPITNQQYVDFLNKVVSRVRVESDVVRSNDQIWLMLGEVTRGYEPIIFRDGRFQVKNAAHSACPILRVTGYGALAYVEFYGLRLPTAREWLFAVTKGKLQSDSSSPTPSESSQGMMGEMQGHMQPTSPSAPGTESDMPLMTPVIMFEPNAFCVRQLNKNIGEWGTKFNQSADPKKLPQTAYVVMGGPARSAGATGGGPSVVQRNPWEAFEEVGFRCVRDAPENPN
ncbi:MAG: SUMF1/EgtB/PvdO family nonheme iron enzyme, partial [Desulfocapsaceae bacterium]|nr:SUMF1/EgtB/PvdO family nonheme iron enzyme [Desulfocapsaceae bacterium]